MVKVRMNTADVAAEVKCLRRLIGMRLSNVYDLTPKTYMFKLMNSSGVTESGESEKVLLLMESGVRLHTTAYVRDKSNTPSGFTLKLRKHIRTRRLEDVRQLGYDRIILFQFGLGANAHYVILELYAQGNIILTDNEFTVLTLLRSHRDDDKGFAIMSRHRYPVEMCRVFERANLVKLKDALTVIKEPFENEPNELNENLSKQDVKKGKQGGKKSGKASGASNTSNDGARTKQSTLKMILGDALGYGPQISEHIILDAGMIPNTKVAKDQIMEDDKIQSLAQAVARFEDWLEDVITGSRIPEGYILMQNKISGEKDSDLKEQSVCRQMYDDYCPILMMQFKSREFVKFETFDAALDDFYSKIESQRVEYQQQAKEGAAVQKLNRIRSDQENRVHVLKKEVESSVKTAQLIEYNLEDVDAAIIAVRVALANGMSWEDLARMVKEEKKSGNPVAGLIDKLYLDRNCMTLLLSNNLDEMDDEEKTSPVDKVEVDISLSAHANARRWYDMKKKQESKQEKTVTAHEKAFKAAERKTRLQLSQEKLVAMITHMRKVHWFEKFNWFVSSENYLVISGRDAQQNEMIVKRYMSKGDLYVHAELHGASSTVIKNHKPESPVPPLTINQAGCYTVCQSQAWDSKIVTSAWWVYPHQVSKTAPTGEYLTVGSFMIRGKKNFLPPHPLVMGFGLLFRLDESSLGSHLNERRVRGEEDGPNTLEDDSFKEEYVSESDEKPREDELEEVEGYSKEPTQKSNTTSAQVNPGYMEEVQVKDKVTLTQDYTEDKPEEKDIIPTTTQLEDLMDRALGLGLGTKTTRDYGKEASSSLSDKDNSLENNNTRDKPYISKAERRKLKKGQQSNNSDADELEKEEKQGKPSANQTGQTNIVTGGGKAIRGQKGKLKKIKEKYADQDDEERKIRMALLASAGNAKKTESIVQDQDATGSKEKKPVNGLEDAPKICYKCKKVGHLSRDCPEHPDGSHRILESKASDIREKKERNDADHPDEADRVVMEEEDIHEIGEEEKEKLNDIDYLTGNPLPNDILLYAVPVCGPYNALQSYKYRVKIIPGTAKKGKAAKTAMNLFGHMAEATNREKELMKACTDPELVAAMKGNVKITAAGLTQLKQKQKKGKKTGKATTT